MSTVSPSVCHEVMGLDAVIFVFWMLSFKPAFSLSSFTSIRRLFSSSSLSAIRMVSSAYLRLSIFLPAVLSSAYVHSSVGKESACNAGNPSSIPGLGRSAGEGKGYPLQYSGLENSTDCIVHGVRKELDTTEQLSLSLFNPAQHFTWCALHIS